jgi:hypothetical protein
LRQPLQGAPQVRIGSEVGFDVDVVHVFEIILGIDAVAARTSLAYTVCTE